MDIHTPSAVIHHVDQILQCMTCAYFLIILPSTASSLRLVSVKAKYVEVGQARYNYAVIYAALGRSLLCFMACFSQIPTKIYVNAHPLACGCRYEWQQPVRAYRLNDVLTAN